MYIIEFYEKSNGECEILEFLEELRKKSSTSKDARIQFKQVSLYIQLLQDNGTHLTENITKYLEDGIWELRPGNNRVFYFCFENNKFILLHHFRKKSQKTPKSELERAKSERNDYIQRNGENIKWKPGTNIKIT